MKKILLSLLALTALAGCSKNESNETPSGAVPIRLGADVEVSSKAPVISGSSVEAGIAGWETTTAVSYATTPTWYDGQIKTTAHPSTGQAVTWENSTQKYYNADENVTTYLKAWYPRGTVDVSSPTAPKVTFSNTDGSVDALLAPAISGTKLDAANKTLAFIHKTAQIKFQVIAGDGLAAGTKVKSIKLNGVSLPTGFDLTKDAAADDAVTYTAAAGGALAVTFDKNSGNPIDIPAKGTTAVEVGQPAMIQPVADNSTVTLDIVTVKSDGTTTAATYTGKAFTTDNSKIEAGKAYTVTLTFSQTAVALKATITDWTSASGEGTIE